MINVVKPYLPPFDEYVDEIKNIWNCDILTNQGPELKKLEKLLSDFLCVENLQYVTNGTLALQLALRALDIIEGEIITTPFTYVATISSILWERCTPVFVDIESNNFTIDSEKIEEAITPNTRAIMPVHVFGYACDVDKIEKIARKYKLKVIYDAAHTFGSKYKGKALSSYGDISTLSFHATKLFHTIEGGACIAHDKSIVNKIDLLKRFGHDADKYLMLGINCKQDEFNAAMGIVNLAHIDDIIASRKKISETYDYYLQGKIQRPKQQKFLEYNYAYYPVVFESEKELLNAFKRLNAIGINPRRYFYPSLNTLPYLLKESVFDCKVSEDISSRIACLPLYPDLTTLDVRHICEKM